PTPRLTARDTAFLDTLEERTFRFFWETANPANGLVPDRYPTPSFSSIAAVGFGLTAYPIGVERGWVSRADARARVLTTLRWLWNAPQGSDATGVTGYKGFFYHFLGMQTGHRYQTVELSSIDTALLLGGVLFCQSYFDQPDPDEGAIRAYADSLVQRVDWQWMQHHAPPLIGMGWSPEEGFIAYDWTGYDEAMLLYVLALGSPTHGIDSTAWSAWTRTYRWGTFEGETYVNFPPLFGHQYSHVWIDFRGIRDAYMRSHGIDYFENSRRATRAQRAYAAANPMGWRDYSDSIWGLTASDGPGDVTHVIDGRARTFHGYTARGVSFYEVSDDGTIAPTAPGGSIAFAPEIAIPALVAMRERYDTLLFSTYGFRDAFNPTLTAPNVATAGRVDPRLGWFDVDYLGIDQGPILAMAENYRTELVWRYMRRNSYIVRGLRRAGFTGGWLDEAAATTRR
ncbi:MAG: Tat pathway signal protein, partial [Gemmatimonadaceae bacterium]|nr:Tat pathway signal protein [Gemmatimonadaceae bacterium]